MTDTTADPTGTATRRPHGRDEVVDSLIAAAAELFSDRGVADVTVREIATAANVNPGLLHRHFGGKDDLVKRVF
ncbi:MAG: helix-turn-helix domain-containing protein, partial [Actinomycetota bacterium]